MNRDQIKIAILAALVRIDYDLSKEFKDDTAEDWDTSRQTLEEAIDLAEEALKEEEQKAEEEAADIRHDKGSGAFYK